MTTGLYAGVGISTGSVIFSLFHQVPIRRTLSIGVLALVLPYTVVSHYSYLMFRDRIQFEKKVDLMLKAEDRRRGIN